MDGENGFNRLITAFRIEDIPPILYKHRRSIGTFMVGVLLAATLFSAFSTRRYRATTVIQLSSQLGQEVNMAEVVDLNLRGYYEIQQFFKTQIDILKSRSVREEVLRRYAALGYDDFGDPKTGVKALADVFDVVPQEQSQLVQLQVVHTDPERAAILANLLADVYTDRNLAVRREASSSATTWLQQQVTEYEGKIEAARAALDAYKTQTNLVDAEQLQGTLAAQLEALNRAYGEQRTQLVLMRTQIATHQKLHDTGALDELTKTLSSPTLDTAAAEHARSAAELADLTARYGPLHPERVQADARLSGLEDTMFHEVARLIDAERAQASILEASIDGLKHEIDDVKHALLDYERAQTRYAELSEELTRLTAFHEKLSKRLEEVRLAARTQLNNVTTIDAAVAPERPFTPNIPLNLMIALLTGLVGGIALALLREYLDDTIHSEFDVETYLHTTFLGFIPKIPDDAGAAQSDLYTRFFPRSAVAEATRRLRTRLEMNAEGVPPKRLIVTSSIAREGKTGTTLRLATSFAQMGKRVLVIDADMRIPRVHKVFQLSKSPGLSNYLTDPDTAFGSLVHDTEIAGLSVVLAGDDTDQPAELLTSPRVRSLLETASEHFDLVLVDTPPAFVLSDAATLSHLVDGILMIVKDRMVSRAVARQTIESFKAVQAKIMGVVLNAVDIDHASHRYGYYDAYRNYTSTYGTEESPGQAGK